MDPLIEQIRDELPPADAQRAYKTLQTIFTNIIDNPGEVKFRSIQKSKLNGKLNDTCISLLEACGFQDNATELTFPSGTSLDAMTSSRDIIECLTLSLEPDSVSPPAGPAAAPGDVDEDAELAEAMRISMMAQEPTQDTDRRLAEQLENEEDKKMDFERFDHEDVIIDDDAVNKINAYCQASGEKYVDPQFPPAPKSLYLDENDATTWECLSCHARTKLPPLPPLPKSREEAEAQQKHWETIGKCSACGRQAHRGITVRYFQRPTQWLRPGVRCVGCEMIYSHLPGGGELVSRMCPHYLRDEMTQTTVGAPWKLIRGEARPEDVCQGAVGNCWFAGALSTVASDPQLVDNMFVTKEYNPHGAYHIRLFHAGEWRSLLVDDLLPTSQVFEGYLDGSSAFYSRGGGLCFLQGARRQIWVPMVEKAAAKLFGCWAVLRGGTFAEALSMFTGFPTQQIKLHVRSEERRRREERKQRKIEARTQLLLQGKPVPEYLEDSDDDDFDNDALTWSKIMSANESGYLMGMGCTEEGCEKTRDQIEAIGLSCPHAYGVLDAREILIDGKMTQLIKVRNPHGERAPFTWKGDWGKDSKKWTFALELELGVKNKAGVRMEDEMSIFWMDFQDVKSYFAAVEVCRVHANWHQCQSKVWLPSGVGPGECCDLTVFRKTLVDIVLWQEKNTLREGAFGARSTNVDVGLTVLRKRGTGSDGQPEYELVDSISRTSSDDCSAEMILEGGYVYRLMPTCLGLMQELAPRSCILAVHSVQKVEMEKTSASWHDLACGVFEACRKHGKRRGLDDMQNGTVPDVSTWMHFDGQGAVMVAENTGVLPCAIQVDASDSTGCVFTRSSPVEVISLPPQSRTVVMGIAPALGSKGYACSLGAVGLGPEAAGWALVGEMLHMPLQLLSPESRNPSSRPPPDQTILKRAPPEVPMPSPKRANSAVLSTTDDDDLAEALRMSLDKQPETVSGKLGDLNASADDDDDLAQAIALSMNAQPAQPAAQPAAPVARDKKALLKQRVQALFEEYRRSGIAPNTAAAKALADAQAELGM